MEHRHQFVRVSQLIAASPLPVFIPPHLETLVQFIAMVEGSEARVELYKRNPSDEENRCPPMAEYSVEWDAIDERIQELVEEIGALATKHVAEVEQLARGFDFSKTRRIAACPKDNCPDRDAAQEHLGWQDGEEVLQ